jgi:hypothetical protein
MADQPRLTYRFHSVTTYAYRDQHRRERRACLNLMSTDAVPTPLEIEVRAEDLKRLIAEARQALERIGSD